MRPMAKETHIKTDKNPLTAGVLGSYLLVLNARATRKVGSHYPYPIIQAAVRVGDLLQARRLATLTNTDIQLCEAAIIKEFGASGSYLLELQQIVVFLANWYEISLIYKRPKTAALRYGVKGNDEGRRDKLIADNVLVQLLSLRLRNDLEPEDKAFINALALNTACGFRISELLTLPADCLCRDEEALFVRSFEAKGGVAAPRFVPSPLWPVVEQAVGDLLELTASGREIARDWAKSLEPDWARVFKDEKALIYFVSKFLHEWTTDPNNQLINPNAAWHFGRAEWIDVLGALERNNGAVNKTTTELNLNWSTFQNLCNQQKLGREGLLYQRTEARTKKIRCVINVS